MKANDGIYPLTGSHEHVLCIGITFRDYLASMCMQGIHADSFKVMDTYEIAEYCYKMADQMIKESEK